jgi:hypothetical protein
MRSLLFSAVLLGCLTSARAIEGSGPAATPKRSEPCYVVIAVDVSANLETLEASNAGPGGKRPTVRDEGQLVCLQLLPFLRSDLYVGVTHFSDRVRYSLPSRETGPLLPWGQTFLNESACRNLVKPVDLQLTSRPDPAEGMNWASERIQAARQQYGPGPAKLILLSRGDPRDSAREMERGRGPLLTAARRFAEQQIQIYPILMEEVPVRPSGQELAVEGLMQSIALMTGGRAYRLTPELAFPDILMDAFDLGTPVSGDLVVSRHDWALVAVGTGLASIAVQPAGGAGPRTMALDDNLQAACGIRTSMISSSGYRTTILRRPGTADLVDRFWQGRWSLITAEDKQPAAVRLYRIPDFLLQLEMSPALPWWRNEQVQLKANLLDRHRETPEARSLLSADGGRGLSIGLKATSADGQSTFSADRGRWTVPGRQYETEPVVVRAPGLYKIAGQVRHTVGDANVPVLRFASDVYVHPACAGLELVNAATGEGLRDLPPTAAKLRINVQGGQEVCLRVAGRGEMKVEPMAGVVHLEGLPQNEWTLQKKDNGDLITGPIPLAEREERLTGTADVEVRTFAGIRHLRLPTFELTYTPAPMRVACTFADPREALWVGELYRQPLTISAFPVFDRFLDQAVGLFPESLAGMHIRTIDMRSGMTQVVTPENRLLERPQPGGYAGRTVSATYFVESTIPLPPSDKCEIDLGGVVENLQGAVKTYAVVDPVAQGMFEWVVRQEAVPRQGPVSETLFCGEPVLFFAGWRADQNVSAVRFEIPQPDAADSIFVDLPVAAGATKAQVEQVVPGLTPGQTLPVYVHVTMQPAPADRALKVKLKGGQFRTEDRRIVLEELAVGDGTPTDIAGHVWEPMELPVRATFRGYRADNLAHNAALEQFKKSCTVTVAASRASSPRPEGEPSSAPSDVKNITDTLEWTSMTPPEGAAGTCRLTGRVTYTPEILGRAAIELTVEAPSVRGATGPSSQRVYAHVLAKEPRFSVVVSRLKPGGEEPVFDSLAWLKSQDAGTPLTTRLSTRLRVDVQSANGSGPGSPQPWKATVRLLRQPAPNASWVSESSEAGELTAGQPLTREVQMAEHGQYALEIVGQDPQSKRRTAYLMTPILASIQPHEVKPAVAPPAWLTARVRQWPFEYLVTLYQDAIDLSRPQALAFQFQLPGQSDAWLDGATVPVGSPTTESRQLLVKGPRLLPASEGLRNGVARFRLSAQGLEVMRWECPSIRVVPPVLEGLVFSPEAAGAALASDGSTLALDGSADLWVRPLFRAAPELDGQWSEAETVVYLWRHSEEDPKRGPADVRVLERLQGQEGSAATTPGLHAYRMENKAGSPAVKVLSRRAPRGFWGWPKKAVSEQYSLIASVVYRSAEADSSAGSSGALPAVAEWSDVYPIHLNAPWVVPMCWWPAVAVLLMAVVAMVLRVLVPSPSRLALDLRLEENVAVVEPVRLDNPVLLDLKETPLVQELVLYTRFLCGQWGTAGRNLARLAGLRTDSTVAVLLGRFLEGIAAVVAPVWVLLRRSLYPRRWAWATVVPRVRDNTAAARTAFLCVWTGLGARRGRVWSSQAGSLKLPEEGQTRSINLDLPYQVGSMDRTMRVTVRVHRMGTEEVRTTAAN